MAESIPKAMEAWVFSSRGTPADTLRLSSFPTPKAPKGSQVMIRVEYCALNSLGMTLMGLLPSILGSTWTALEFDVAGTVIAAGPSASASVPVGTVVWGYKDVFPTILEHSGTLAEYVVTDSSLVAPLPKGQTAKEAAGLGIVGGTALQLLQTAGAKPGDRILINGASGGVGSMAVQIGKAMGVHITAVCSGSNSELVKGLGADQIVDYRSVQPSVTGFLKDTCGNQPFDAILDCVGSQDIYEASPEFLKPDGKVVCVGALDGMWAHLKQSWRNNYLPVVLGGTPRKWLFISAEANAKTISQLKQYADEGKLKATVDSEFKMEDALAAYARLGSQRARGKVLVKVS